VSKILIYDNPPYDLRAEPDPVFHLDRPILRQIFPKGLIIGIIAALGAQALEHCNNFLLIHLHRVGDHARGLFEAEASIAVSAAHAL
jgi:hypothetical protein